LCFNDFYFTFYIFFSLLFIWYFFFKINSVDLSSNKNYLNKTTFVSVNKLSINLSFINLYLYIIFLNVVGIFSMHGKNLILFFGHINLSNFVLFNLYSFLFVSLFMFSLIKSFLIKLGVFKSIDYLFSINNLTLILPYLFLSNTVFTFLFILELISVTLFYKLVSSKIWFKNSQLDTRISTKNIQPQNYINMVFFQYWVTFFSTIFIIYFYISFFYIFGTSDWFTAGFINNTQNIFISLVVYDVNVRYILFLFIFSVFFKLGITPLHLFKIEVYKGIPFLSIFFYTTFYFLNLFLFFVVFLVHFLFSFISYFYFFLVVLLFVGSLFIIIYLFDVSFIKVFFTYSTIINTIGFLIVLVATI